MAKVEHFEIPVIDNDQGQLWAFDDVVYRDRRPVLLTVPPQLARWPDEFLLPSAVVTADGLTPP